MNKENAKSLITATGILLGLLAFEKIKDTLEMAELQSSGKCEICGHFLYYGKPHKCRGSISPAVFERFQNDFWKFLETPAGKFQQYLADARRNPNKKNL